MVKSGLKTRKYEFNISQGGLKLLKVRFKTWKDGLTSWIKGGSNLEKSEFKSKTMIDLDLIAM